MRRAGAQTRTPHAGRAQWSGHLGPEKSCEAATVEARPTLNSRPWLAWTAIGCTPPRDKAEWRLTTYVVAAAMLNIPSLGGPLALSEVYQGVDFNEGRRTTSE